MRIPDGWHQEGTLPDSDPLGAGESGRDLLLEDMVHLVSPCGRFMIEVGWVPQADPRGEFLAEVALDGEWDPPLEAFRTRSLDDLRRWLEHKATELS